MLLDAESQSLFVDWETQARVAVENLRLEAGNDPDDRATAELIAELRERSPQFSTWWDEHVGTASQDERRLAVECVQQLVEPGTDTLHRAGLELADGGAEADQIGQVGASGGVQAEGTADGVHHCR